MKLILELFLWAKENEDIVRYHHAQKDITQSSHDPDTLVIAYLDGLGMSGGAGARFAHSTSWRYDGGRTLLSYLVWVDVPALAALPTRCLTISTVKSPSSCSPLAPRPESLDEEQVLIHGLRHLRYLVFDRQDATAVGTFTDPETCRMIQALAPAAAGRIPFRWVHRTEKARLAQ